jgi:hypothetical protein
MLASPGKNLYCTGPVCGSQTFIAMLLFDPSMSALPIMSQILGGSVLASLSREALDNLKGRDGV